MTSTSPQANTDLISWPPLPPALLFLFRPSTPLILDSGFAGGDHDREGRPDSRSHTFTTPSASLPPNGTGPTDRWTPTNSTASEAGEQGTLGRRTESLLVILEAPALSGLIANLDLRQLTGADTGIWLLISFLP